MKTSHELIFQKGFECFWGFNERMRDAEAAKKLLQNAIREGNRAAQYLWQLGYTSTGNVKNLQDIVEQLKIDAETRNSWAQCILGVCYEEGLRIAEVEIIPKDLVQAARSYAEAIASDATNAHALNNLGSCYAQGKGVERDLKRAQELYKQSAELDNPWGQNRLGLLLSQEGNHVGALPYYTQAVKQGYEVAQFNLGRCFEEGSGTAIDLKQAREYYKQAAEQGQIDALKKLLEFYYRSAIRRHPNAQQELEKLLAENNALQPHYEVLVKQHFQNIGHRLKLLQDRLEGQTRLIQETERMVTFSDPTLRRHSLSDQPGLPFSGSEGRRNSWVVVEGSSDVIRDGRSKLPV